MPHKPPSQAQQLAACKRWNEFHAIGTPVTVELDSGEIRATRTRSPALMHGTQIAAIWLQGFSGLCQLSRVRAKGEAHHAV